MTYLNKNFHVTGGREININFFEPLNSNDLKNFKGSKIIPSGGMHSYSSSFYDEESVSIKTTNLNKIISLDEVSLLVEVESGVSFGELLTFLWERGYDFPVVPGFPGITIGGGLAVNCHGKNPYIDGAIADWVHSFRLLMSNGNIINVDRSSNFELFNMTLGGYGLSGLIIDITLRVREEVRSCYLQRAFKFSDPTQFVNSLISSTALNDICYGWINLEGNFKGIVFCTEPISDGITRNTFVKRVSLPRSFFGINFWGMGLAWIANSLFFIATPTEMKLSKLNVTFPLYFKRWIFALFPADGFSEFQIILNEGLFIEYILLLSDLKKRYRVNMPIATCRLFSSKRSLLKFSDTGIGVGTTICGPDRGKVIKILEDYCLKNDILVNISKCSNVNRALYEKTYRDIQEFRMLRKKYGFNNFYSSALSRALDI